MPQNKAVPRQGLFSRVSISMWAYCTKATENRSIPLRLEPCCLHNSAERLSRNKPYSAIYSKQHEPQHLVPLQDIWPSSRMQCFQKVTKLNCTVRKQQIPQWRVTWDRFSTFTLCCPSQGRPWTCLGWHSSPALPTQPSTSYGMQQVTSGF